MAALAVTGVTIITRPAGGCPAPRLAAADRRARRLPRQLVGFLAKSTRSTRQTSDYLLIGSSRASTHVAGATGKFTINTQILRAREAGFAQVAMITLAIVLLLLAPAIWNGYPLLQ